MPTTGHAVEQSNKGDYVTLENIDPASTEEEIYTLLLQAIQGVQSAGLQCLSPLLTPELATPPPNQPDVFLNWKQDLYIPGTSVHLSLEQLQEVVVAEELGQREVKNEEDLIFGARECY